MKPTEGYLQRLAIARALGTADMKQRRLQDRRIRAGAKRRSAKRRKAAP